MNNSINKTIFLKIEKIYKDLKFGDICKVVFKKNVKDKSECFLRLPDEKWSYVKKNSIVLIIDKKLPKIYYESKFNSEFFCHYIKVLYEDQVGFISAGWLKKMK